MDEQDQTVIDSIWEEDLLGRKEEAQHLLRFLESKYQNEASSPFSINIDTSWGYGKTFFIKHFAEQLKLRGYPVVIFDAWKNDFSDQALLSFISEVCESLDRELNSSKRAKQEVSKLKQWSKSLIKPALPLILSVIAKQLTGKSLEHWVDSADEGDVLDTSVDNEKDTTIEDLSEKLTSIAATKALEQYSEKKNATEGFINTIQQIVRIIDSPSYRTKQLPIFIFVDELDRCRPTFSIELLEAIKHLFSVPGIFFLVSTDTKQLCHSIRSVYGSEFDASRYLKRFFDMEYNLEEPDNLKLVTFLFEQHPIQETLYFPEINYSANHSAVSIQSFFNDTCAFFKLGPRDIQQVFGIIKNVAYMSDKNLHLIYLMYVVCMKHKYPDRTDLLKPPIKLGHNEDFLEELILSKELGMDLGLYQDYSRSNSNNLLNVSVFGLMKYYLKLVGSNLRSENAMTDKQRLIFLNIRRENEVQDTMYHEPNLEEYDEVLTKYYSLVCRAGKFLTTT